MATINSSSLHNATNLLSLPSFSSSQNAPTFSLYLQSKPFFTSLSTSFTHTIKSKRWCRNVVVSALCKIAESELIAFPAESEGISGVFPAEAGVYAVYDENSQVQFIGISRNIAASVNGHRKSVPELCSSVKVGVVEEPDRTALTQAWKSWMEEHIAVTGKIPPGNETGNSTWVRKSPKKKPDLKLTPGRNVQLTVPLEQLIDRLVKENKVVAFIKGSRSAPLCGFSQKVVGILESEGADYESVDVLDEEYNSGLRETLKKYSNWPTFPQVFVNGDLVGGCDILSSMHEKGELASLLK